MPVWLLPIVKAMAAVAIPALATGGAAWLGKRAAGTKGPAAVALGAGAAAVTAAGQAWAGWVDSTTAASGALVGNATANAAWHWWKDRADRRGE